MSSYLDAIQQTSSATASTTTKKKDETTLGKEDFLSLLVAQLKNQDPLNPDDPTQFTAQLAQFSQLEQLFNLNGSMNNLVTAYQNTDKLTALNTIGKEVAFKSSTFTFDGTPMTLGYTLADQAADVSIALRKDGVTVAVLSGEELGKGTHYLTWDGLDSRGKAASAGQYSIIVDAKGFQGESQVAEPIVRATVTGADLDGASGGTLLTDSGEINFSTILGVFERSLKTGSTTGENG